MSVERVLCPRITSPCTQKLEFARGQRTAFCGLCQKNVHNISAMSASERAQLWVREQVPCIRYVALVPVAALALAATAQADEIEVTSLEPVEVEATVIVGGIGAPAEEIFLVSEGVDEPWLDETSNTSEAP